MRLSIIIIGDEILLGQVTDTNSGTLARTFGPLGWEVAAIHTVGDDAAAIREAIEKSLDESSLVITTGGLGPTKDDITKGVLMSVFGGSLREDKVVLENVRAVFLKRGLQMNDLTLSQAMVPTSCRVIPNRYGTAPCMIFEKDGRVLASLPGVPFETEGILANGELTAFVKKRFCPDMTFIHRSLMVSGITESALAQHLSDFESSLPEGLHLAYLPSPGYIHLRLDGRAPESHALEEQFDRTFSALEKAVAPFIIYHGVASPAEILLDAVRRRKLTLASAESCTGGNIAHSITAVSGCSDVYLGSVVSYANEVKEGVLGVSSEALELYGAVSEPVVRQMVCGVMKATGATAAMATSGVAGPGGGTPEKPVGTVWIAVGYIPAGETEAVVEAKCHHFPGKRERVIDRATTQALLDLRAIIG